jgi:hypothetical protein
MKPYVKHLSPRNAYRQQQGLRIQAASTLAAEFGALKSLAVEVRAYDGNGVAKTGTMKCRYNLGAAKSVLRFDCPNSECVGGDFDFTEILASAVQARRTTVTCELPCKGRRDAAEVNAIPYGPARANAGLPMPATVP